MIYHPLSNPLSVLSRYGPDQIVNASPRTLKRYLAETKQTIVDLKIEIHPAIDRWVQEAFENLDQTFRTAMKRTDTPEKSFALAELKRWQNSYQRRYSDVTAITTTNPEPITLYEPGLEDMPIVRDPLYLNDSGFFTSDNIKKGLPESVNRRLGHFARAIHMYSGSFTEEGYQGMRKAAIEGSLVASLLGIKFLEVSRPELVRAAKRFVGGCLTKTYGHDNSAQGIAGSGLPIERRTQLFIEKVDLAARAAEDFGAHLHYDFDGALDIALIAYTDHANRDVGVLLQLLERETNPVERRKLEEEVVNYREIRESVGERYNTPLLPPQINVKHVKLPSPKSVKPLIDRLQP